MDWLGYVAVGAALLLFLLHRVVARRYIAEYVAVRAELPTWQWLTTADDNATVEQWRRRRLLVDVPLIMLIVVVVMWFLIVR